MSHRTRYRSYDEKESATPADKRKPIMEVEASYFAELFRFIDLNTYVDVIHLPQIRCEVTLFYTRYGNFWILDLEKIATANFIFES